MVVSCLPPLEGISKNIVWVWMLLAPAPVACLCIRVKRSSKLLEVSVRVSCLTLPYLTLLYPISPYFTLLDPSYFTLLYLTLPYSSLSHLTLPYLTVLYLTSPYSALLQLTLYLPSPYFISPYFTLPQLTLYRFWRHVSTSSDQSGCLSVKPVGPSTHYSMADQVHFVDICPLSS